MMSSAQQDESIKSDKSKKESVSFSLISKKPGHKLAQVHKSIAQNLERENYDGKPNENEKDYIKSAEENKLQSVAPKKEKGKLVVECIHQNKWRLEGVSDLDKEAANEILKGLNDEEDKDNSKGDMSIPMLMRNRVPKSKGHDEEDYAFDVSVRPEQSTLDDYEDIPISSFGTAMLRGMGWSEGKPIGSTNKGLAEPIEYIPRHKGLGLGADKRPDQGKVRKRKMGEDKNKKNHGPIVEKDGKVRHVRRLGEQVQEKPEGFFIGAYVQIEKGRHQLLYGKIVAVDEDNARISVQLAISKETIQISQYNTSLVDKEEFLANATKKQNRNEKEENGLAPNKSRKPNHENGHTDSQYTPSSPEPCWMMPNIRVRIISQKYRKGFFYNKKVNILDVISKDTCTCKTEDKKLLEDVKQTYLETVIPKSKNAYIMVLRGKHKGQLGKILERDAKECRAVIQLTSNKHVTKLYYDYISEYIGEYPDDNFV